MLSLSDDQDKMKFKNFVSSKVIDLLSNTKHIFLYAWGIVVL